MNEPALPWAFALVPLVDADRFRRPPDAFYTTLPVFEDRSQSVWLIRNVLETSWPMAGLRFTPTLAENVDTCLVFIDGVATDPPLDAPLYRRAPAYNGQVYYRFEARRWHPDTLLRVELGWRTWQ